MTVTYRSNRSAIAKAYSLLHNPEHRSYWALWIGLLAAVGFAWGESLDLLPARSAMLALLLATLGAILFAVAPQLLVKTQQRALTISRDGMSVVIGERSKLIPWPEVADVGEWDDFVRITSVNLHAMLVPFEAFEKPSVRAEFIRRCREWLPR